MIVALTLGLCGLMGAGFLAVGVVDIVRRWSGR
jgi:hypothetical protein